MTAQLPDFLLRGTAIVIFAIGIGLVAVHTTLAVLAAQRRDGSRPGSLLLPGAIGAYLAVWFALALTLGDPANFPLQREGLRRLYTLLAGFGPMLVAVALLFASRALGSLNAAMPASWLIRAQTYRVAGLMFIFPFLYYGVVPAGFAIPAALGDFVTGALAPIVARAVAERQPRAIAWARAWNLFGVLDLIVAPASAVLSGARVLGLYPLSLVPLFIGPPLGILAHVYSLRNLAATSSAATAGVSPHPTGTAHAHVSA